MPDRGRLVVLSPHLDDAVLSLGALIADETSRGGRAAIVTAFAGDPSLDLPASGWDRRCGFEDQKHATAVRRTEDARACELVGAIPVWLPHAPQVYGPVDPDQMWDQIEPHLDAEIVLVPGWPLRHPDHRWLTELVMSRWHSRGRLGVYAEQPYAFKRRSDEPDSILEIGHVGLEWSPTASSDDARRAKASACRCYASQIRPLARRWPLLLKRIERHERRLGGERVAWIQNEPIGARFGHEVGVAQ